MTMDEMNPTHSDEFEGMNEQALDGQAADWYGKWREKIYDWLSTNTDETLANLLISVPDMFALLAGLARDSRVPFLLKAQLVAALAYVISPVDLMPEAVMGVVGLTDDLTVMSLAILALQNTKKIDIEVLRDHWRGEGDPLEAAQTIQQTIEDNAERLLGSGVYQQLKRRFGGVISPRLPFRGRSKDTLDPAIDA